MYEISLNTNIISEDQLGYEVTGMINPEFHNDGNVDVTIQNQVIKPGKSFEAQFPGMVLRGKVNIVFKEEDNQAGGDAPIQKVVLHFGKYLGPFVDPQTGLLLNSNQKAQVALHNSNCN